MKQSVLKIFLDEKVEQYNQPSFIISDPISVPHGFSKKQDIEIAALFAAVLAWGQRKTIINKCNELMNLMDNCPHEFILEHSENELKKLIHFKHRTFNTTDLLYFIHFLRAHYQKNNSLETAFCPTQPPQRGGVNAAKKNINTEFALRNFYNYFCSLPDFPSRTKKHISTPERNSTCKRMNMFLRWMVRTDNRGVDFGIWKKIKPSQLICPMDLHVERVARKLKLIKRKQNDWQTTLELTNTLKQFDATDPVKYDFALFGLGIFEKF